MAEIKNKIDTVLFFITIQQMEECNICFNERKEFYISPCTHKWCMKCNLNPKFPRKCPFCRIQVPLSPKSRRKVERKEQREELKKVMILALSNTSFNGMSI